MLVGEGREGERGTGEGQVRDRGGARKERGEEGRVLEHATAWMPQLRDGLTH